MSNSTVKVKQGNENLDAAKIKKQVEFNKFKHETWFLLNSKIHGLKERTEEELILIKDAVFTNLDLQKGKMEAKNVEKLTKEAEDKCDLIEKIAERYVSMRNADEAERLIKIFYETMGYARDHFISTYC